MATAVLARLPVDSSTIASVGYAPEGRVLEVEFRRGPVYRYFGVPETAFIAFIDAPSKGAYFNTSIRSHFSYERR
jgi:KTSC domain-containing protein